MILTPLEALLIAGFGATFTALLSSILTSKAKERKFITRADCSACTTRQWIDDIKQVLRDTGYLKQVVRLLAEDRIPQETLIKLENDANKRTL